METRHDIGKAFSGSLKTFEKAPDAAMWDSIAAELNTSSKVLFPIWLQVLGGITTIAILLTGFYFLNDSNSTKDTNLTTTVPKKTNKTKTLDYKDVPTAPQKQTALYPIAAADSLLNRKTTPSKPKQPLGVLNGSVASEQKDDYNYSSDLVTREKQSTPNQNQNTDNSEASFLISKRANSAAAAKEDLAMQAYLDRIASQLEMSKSNTYRLAAIDYQNWLIRQKAIIAQNNQIFLSKIKTKAIAGKKDKKKKTTKLPRTDIERELKRTEATTYGWAVSPYVSTLQYSSFVKGSSIDDRLKNNPREGIATRGYGITAERTISEKMSIRFGVGYAPLQYRTENFQVTEVDGVLNIFQLQAISGDDINAGALPTNAEATAFFNQNDVVSIDQEISYIEIPVDFSYKLINKRVSLSTFAGLSLLVLNDNSIFATAKNNRLQIGNDRNLSALGLGFQAGAGLHYNATKNWRFNFEPVVRMQLTPYKDSETNFSPFYTGLQFGLSYKFK